LGGIVTPRQPAKDNPSIAAKAIATPRITCTPLPEVTASDIARPETVPAKGTSYTDAA
jgi:hypothetical protein